MNSSIGGLVVCLLGLVACNVERYEDCDEDDFEDRDGFGGSHSRAGTSSTSGKAGSASAAAGAASGGSGAASGGSGAASGGSGAGGGEGVVPPDPCAKERDCAPGYNCDPERQECVPAAEETCGELETETACTHRNDCTPIYGGTNCSCGQDCECKGGEPGCICETFQFFACEATPQ
jgi:hypothetical protein